jgi:hypothetical protein
MVIASLTLSYCWNDVDEKTKQELEELEAINKAKQMNISKDKRKG